MHFRRTISIILVITGLFTAVTGLWNFFPPFNSSFSPGHAVGASIFGIVCFIHTVLNLNSIIKYFKSLGWWWLAAAAGLAVTFAVALIGLLRT